MTGRGRTKAILNKHKTDRIGKGLVREPAVAYDGPGGEVMLYHVPDGTVTLDVHLERESIWLSLNQMVALFERDKSVISRHLRNVFKSNELERDSVVAFFATTAADGKVYQVEYFNLDAIISVGYRVNSRRGTVMHLLCDSSQPSRPRPVNAASKGGSARR
jgi:hypothetical protein